MGALCLRSPAEFKVTLLVQLQQNELQELSLFPSKLPSPCFQAFSLFRFLLVSGFPLKGHKRLRKNNQPKQREEHKAPPHSASLALVFFLFSSFPKLVLYTRFHTLTFPPLQCVTNQLDSYRKMSCKQWRHRRHQNQDCATVSTDGSTAVGAEVFLHDSKPTRANYDATTKHKNSFFRRRGSTLHEEKIQKAYL